MTLPDMERSAIRNPPGRRFRRDTPEDGGTVELVRWPGAGEIVLRVADGDDLARLPLTPADAIRIGRTLAGMGEAMEEDAS